ncbi:MAG: phosphoglycerate dehydrogenase [SAR202 cluster bacterium]|nr:phosphoglycerate dehydrogenase [SAR202 cluster bacterium]
MARILVADPVDNAGVQRLKAAGHQVDVKHGLKPHELEAIIGDYEALAVRSETKVTAAVLAKARKMQVVGRAGVGVDNIDLEAATQHGVAVVNAPTGNTVAAAEHALAMMMALSRYIPQADASMRRGEWNRRAFMGVEMRNKTLGVIGLGKVGSEVARRAKAFPMRILAYDPYVPQDFARSMGVETVDMDTLLAQSDYITIHTPLTAATKHLIGAEQFEKLKPGVRIVNAARGGLVDETLLDAALKSGKVAGAALDVFSQEPPPQNMPLLANPKCILTPHLGASTEEAQVEVAVEVAEQMLAILNGQPARYTVNVPFVPADVREALAPYLPVATKMAHLAIQLAEGQLEGITLKVSGDLARYNTASLAAAALVGILAGTSEERVNLVNAPVLARERGINVVEQKDPSADPQYSNLVGIEVKTNEGSVYIAGTTVGGKTHLLRLNDFYLDMEPSAPYMLFTSHIDRPGMIGRVGTIAGEHDVNISFMEVGREAPRGRATMIVGLDDAPSAEMLAKIRGIDGVVSVKVVTP